MSTTHLEVTQTIADKLLAAARRDRKVNKKWTGYAAIGGISVTIDGDGAYEVADVARVHAKGKRGVVLPVLVALLAA